MEGLRHMGKVHCSCLAVIGIVFLLSWPMHGVLASQKILQSINTDAFAKAYFVFNPQQTTLRAYLVFDQGEFHNTYAEGLAHYVEHLAWLDNFKDPGAARHANAWTGLYSTGYWVEFDKREYKSRLKSLFNVTNPWTLEERFMLEERVVVAQEFNNRFVEDPYFQINLDITRALLGKSGHARSVIGMPESIRQFELADARNLHQQTHQMKNATLLISGNSSSRQLARWLDAMDLPAVTPRADATTQTQIDLPDVQDEQALVSDSVPGGTFYYKKLVALPDCGSLVQCIATLQVSSSVIDSSMPGGIADALRYDNFIARTFSFDLSILGNSHAMMSFVAEPDAGIGLDTLQEAFVDVWRATANGGIPRKSIERMRRRLLDNIDNTADKPAYALQTVLDQLSVGAPVFSPEDYRSALMAVSYEKVMNLLQALHDDDGRLVVRRVSTAP